MKSHGIITVMALAVFLASCNSGIQPVLKTIDNNDDNYLPAPDEFVPVEIQPEMIYCHRPEYPRLAKEAGITGVVWVKALVDKDGNVRTAMVGKSSGYASLDEAAVEAAYKCKYKPAIQNGRPIAVWVTYKVEFVLTGSG